MRIELNAATERDLRALGIKPEVATAIVSLRQEMGRFSSSLAKRRNSTPHDENRSP